jgi:hypothetical protein
MCNVIKVYFLMIIIIIDKVRINDYIIIIRKKQNGVDDMKILDMVTKKVWESVLCEVSDSNVWITPDRNIGFVVPNPGPEDDDDEDEK